MKELAPIIALDRAKNMPPIDGIMRLATHIIWNPKSVICGGVAGNEHLDQAGGIVLGAKNRQFVYVCGHWEIVGSGANSQVIDRSHSYHAILGRQFKCYVALLTDKQGVGQKIRKIENPPFQQS